MMDELKQIIVNHQNHIADEMDARILEFFGSVEAVKEFAYLYTIDTETLPMETTMDDMSYSVVMEQRHRIRLKTKEELERDL